MSKAAFLLLFFSSVANVNWGFPGGSVLKNPPANAADMGSIRGPGKTPGGENCNPLQCSCLENAVDRGACRATIHGATKSWS